MSYVVLARKYRPANLGALVGQEHIGRALRNAIAMDRVAHAFLFCGARGTGKTSTARILAKMLNCVDGPTATPCGECAPCREIATSTCIDVHELDAASNRGINEIRELREGVGYAPARDRTKVYIIDEAHMLTTEAANAFLKTLEEPPPHVVFVLATTDPQRLPITIRSRCQRYDFRRIRSAEVVRCLAGICEAEGVKIDQESLFLIAREGDGSMRDSLSVLDQVIAFGGAEMAADEVAALLGVADRNRTATLMQALLDRDAPRALEAVGAAHTHGMDLRTFGRTLAMEARDLLMIRLAGKSARDLVDRAETEVQALAEMVAQHSTQELERLAHVLLELAETISRARHSRLVMELGVVRLCRAPALRDVGELASRVEAMLQQAPRLPPRPSGGGGQAADGASGRSTGAAPARSSGAGGGGGPRAAGTAGHAHDPTLVTQRSVAQPPVARQPSESAHRGGGGGRLAGSSAAVAVERPAPAVRADDTPHAAATPRATGGRPGRSLHDTDLGPWLQVVRQKMGEKIAAGILEHAVVHSSGPGRAMLSFSSTFMTRQCAATATLAVLAAAAGVAFGGTYEVDVGPIEERAGTDSLSARGRAAAALLRADHQAALSQDLDVRRVLDRFGGDLVATVPEADASPHEPTT